jgi:hypothetical protein
MITIKLTPQKVFADNIVDHMNLSKTVIPVLSNNFARSEWCLFQLAVARNLHFKVKLNHNTVKINTLSLSDLLLYPKRDPWHFHPHPMLRNL